MKDLQELTDKELAAYWIKYFTGYEPITTTEGMFGVVYVTVNMSIIEKALNNNSKVPPPSWIERNNSQWQDWWGCLYIGVHYNKCCRGKVFDEITHYHGSNSLIHQYEKTKQRLTTLPIHEIMPEYKKVNSNALALQAIETKFIDEFHCSHDGTEGDEFWCNKFASTIGADYSEMGKISHKQKDDQGRSLRTLKLHKEKDEQGRSLHAIKLGKICHKEKDEQGRSLHTLKVFENVHKEKDEQGRSLHAIACAKEQIKGEFEKRTHPPKNPLKPEHIIHLKLFPLGKNKDGSIKGWIINLLTDKNGRLMKLNGEKFLCGMNKTTCYSEDLQGLKISLECEWLGATEEQTAQCLEGSRTLLEHAKKQYKETGLMSRAFWTAEKGIYETEKYQPISEWAHASPKQAKLGLKKLT